MKRKYKSPQIILFEISIENSLAVGSVITKPSSQNDVTVEWETDPDQNFTFNWD